MQPAFAPSEAGLGAPLFRPRQSVVRAPASVSVRQSASPGAKRLGGSRDGKTATHPFYFLPGLSVDFHVDNFHLGPFFQPPLWRFLALTHRVPGWVPRSGLVLPQPGPPGPFFGLEISQNFLWFVCLESFLVTFGGVNGHLVFEQY